MYSAMVDPRTLIAECRYGEKVFEGDILAGNCWTSDGKKKEFIEIAKRDMDRRDIIDIGQIDEKHAFMKYHLFKEGELQYGDWYGLWRKVQAGWPAMKIYEEYKKIMEKQEPDDFGIMKKCFAMGGCSDPSDFFQRLEKDREEFKVYAPLKPEPQPEPQPPSFLPIPIVKEYIYKQTPQGDLKAYVHFPSGWKAGDKRTAMVLFFGGGFTAGVPEDVAVIAQYFAERGFVVVRPDYRVRTRYYPEGTSANFQIGQCFEDGKNAVGWVREHAASLGIDPNAIVGSGASAGAVIAAISAMNNEDPSSKPNALVLFSAPLLERSLSGFMDADDGLLEKISPILHLHPDTVPIILLAGTADGFVEDAREFLAKAKSLNQHTELYTAPTGLHGFYGAPGWFPGTMYAVENFLFSTGFLKEQPAPLSYYATLTKEE